MFPCHRCGRLYSTVDPKEWHIDPPICRLCREEFSCHPHNVRADPQAHNHVVDEVSEVRPCIPHALGGDEKCRNDSRETEPVPRAAPRHVPYQAYEDHTWSYAKVFFCSSITLLVGYYVYTAIKKVKMWLEA